MRNAVVLVHAEFEGPGRIANILREEGCDVSLRHVFERDEVPLDLSREDLLVIMGGPMSVHDRHRPEYAFLERERLLLEQRIRDDAPVLGICLGAQLLALAAGASVSPMTRSDDGSRVYEVGWAPVRFHPIEDDLVLAGMPDEAAVLHWHGEAFELPRDARRLASSVLCPNQGFQLRERLFGLQFHCEVEPDDIETFLRTDTDYVVNANGVRGPETLRLDSATHYARFWPIGDQLLRNVVRRMLGR